MSGQGWAYEAAFARHEGLINPDEQQRLRRSHVAIVGMGGVGGVHLITLGRLGIGRFSIADLDAFDVANMNRQYGARTDTLGRPKVEVMAEEIRRINPEVELRIFDHGVGPENIGDFLSGVDLFVDGIDFFAIDLRRRLFREAAQNGIHAVTAGPIGFSTAWLVFGPNGMSFDEYFDLSDGQPELEQLVAFAVGLTPAMTHTPYMDLSKIDVANQRGPSAGLACQLCAGVAAAESLKILLGRGPVRCAPAYSQFDAYRGLLRRGRLWRGNRHPVQKLRRWALARKLRSLPSTDPVAQPGVEPVRTR